MLTGTYQLANTLNFKQHLHTLEIHGFFFHEDDLLSLIKSIGTCHSLKRIQFSNNNLEDYGAELIARLIVTSSLKLELLSLYNNNIGDEGAQFLADALIDYPHLRILNLSMNFIHDQGACLFVDCVVERMYPNIHKRLLLNNLCTERLKKYVILNAPISCYRITTDYLLINEMCVVNDIVI